MVKEPAVPSAYHTPGILRDVWVEVLAGARGLRGAGIAPALWARSSVRVKRSLSDSSGELRFNFVITPLGPQNGIAPEIPKQDCKERTLGLEGLGASTTGIT